MCTCVLVTCVFVLQALIVEIRAELLVPTNRLRWQSLFAAGAPRVTQKSKKEKQAGTVHFTST